MDTLQERLRNLRGDRSRGQIEKYVGIPASTLQGWEEKTTLSLTYLEQLARYYNVSTDYLLGLVDNPTAIVLNERAREIKNWPPSVQELADVASRLPSGMVESLITLARQCAEINENENKRVFQELTNVVRHRLGDEAAEQLNSLFREAFGVVE